MAFNSPPKIMAAMLTACLLACCSQGFSQPENTYLNDVVMPSPNAASLGKYGDIPVNYSTGVPDIGIPIYTLKEGPLSLPISLSYHASGIKVAEPASWVGTGWSLNAGGIISRTVLGIRDEGPGGYYHMGATVPNDIGYDMIRDAGNGVVDTEPDIYSFNIDGHAGKFIMDKDHNAHFIPKQDLKLDFEYNASYEGFQWFTITTPDGTRYHFGNLPGGTSNAGIEQTAISQGGNGGGGAFEVYNSSWHLVQVESADLKWHIDLSYEDEVYSVTYLASCQNTVFYCENAVGLSTGQDIGCSGKYDHDINKYLNKVSTAGKRLSLITVPSSTQNVSFVAGELRQDLSPADYIGGTNTAKALGNIGITSGTFCQKWEFSYDYFIDPGKPDRSEYKRLKLNQIQQKPCSGVPGLDIPQYQFYYEGTLNSDGTVFLPNRLSKSIDHWGFYNGEGNEQNQVNVPQTTVNVTLNGQTVPVTYGDGKRESNGAKAKTGTLKQIQYPTGGSTYFSFESNTYHTESTQTDNVIYLSNCGYPPVITCCSNNLLSDSKVLSAEHIDYGQFKLRIDAVDNTNGNNVEPCYEDPYHLLWAIVKITAKEVSTGDDVGHFEFHINPQHELSKEYIKPLKDLEINKTFIAGWEYEFILEIENGGGLFDLTATYPVEVEKEVGGLRIKEIRNSPWNSTGNDDMVRTYDYSSDGQGKSSGNLYYTPVYGYSGNGQSQGIQYYFYQFTDESIVPLGNFEGYHIGYSKVTENHSGNGKKTLSFKSELVPYQYLIPTPPTLATIENGKLESESVQDQDGVEVQHTSITDITAYENLPGFVWKIKKMPQVSCEGANLPSEIYAIAQYFPRTGVYHMATQMETLDGVEKTTSYEYNGNHHLFPTAEYFQNSDGKTHRTEYFYPGDADWDSGTESDAIDKMITNHMIGIPLRVQNIVDGTRVSGTWTEYKDFDGNGLGLYPFKFYSWEHDFENYGTSSLWAEKGEVTQRYTSNGLPQTFALKPTATPTTDGWALEHYEWETNGLIKKRTYQDFIWQYLYHDETRLLKSITDIDGQSVSFNYDPLMRLKETSARDGNVKTTYDYLYGNPEEWQGGNKITTFTDYSDFDDQTTIQYFDGLGRALDTWRMGYGPQHQNIVAEKIFYDDQGRVEKKSYMPDTKGGLVYTTYGYEKSPLNRLLSETHPDGNLVESAFAGEGNYYLTTVTDENEHNTATLTDILGRKTEVRGELGTVTQFIYDDKNNLKKVINPESQEYRYTYDARNRLTQKTVPGADCQDFYYDDRNLLVASRDGNLYHEADRWIVNDYDIYGRVARTGLGSPSPGAGFAPCGGILPNGLQFNISDELITNIYDAQGSSSCYASYTPIGKLGSTAVRVINSDGTLGGMLSAKYCYDQYGRAETTESDLYEAGIDIHNTTYDIADHVKNITRKYNDNELTVSEDFIFDHGGRVTSQSHNIPGLTGAGLAVMQYNSKDQLTDKLLGGLAGMTYQYNTMGWLTHINHMPFNNTAATLTCEDPAPPPGGGDDTGKCGECGDDLFNIEQILNLRFKKKLNVDCYIPCDCNKRCTPALVQPCADTTGAGGSGTVSTAGLNYPSWLYEIQKCTGEDDHVLENDLSYVPETYAVKSRILLENADQNFKVETAEGDQTVNLPGLIGLINQGGEVKVKTGREEFCLECETGLPGCSPEDSMAQLSFLETLEANLIHDISGLQLPTNLIRIRLCNGREIYLFEEEFQYLTGGFIVLQVIGITDSAQRLVLGSDSGGETNVYVSYYLQLRDLGPDWVINYYRPCENNECATLDEKHYAKSVGASTIFSTYDGVAPYQDLTQTSPHSVNSLIRDEQNWIVTGPFPGGEAEWDMGISLLPDAQLQAYRVIVYIPYMENVTNCRIGLHDGNQFVPVNGGQNYITLNGYTFNQMPFLVLTPDNLPSAQAISKMKVAITIESRTIYIDAVYVELDYTHPCDRCTQQDPVCTPEEQAAQLASLDSIKELARSLPVSEIPLPTNLYRVKLCNGDEVYLLQHELDLLPGNYIILQSVTVNNLTQTFTTGFPSTTGTPYTGPPPPRYDLFALKLLYYGNDSQIKGVNKGYGNGNIAAMHWQITGRDRQAYSFLYDDLDRLKHGFYAEITKNDFYYNRGLYDEWSITYDLIGNLETLNRNGAYGGCDENGQFLFQYGQIDDLIYKYDTDRTHLDAIADNAGGDAALKGVRSPENAYDYDFNGNLISDTGKGMTAGYNHLNLPREVTLQSINGIDPGGIIQWTYDATGRKLKKVSPDGITLYHNGIEKAGGGTFVYHAEGRAAFYPANPNLTPPQPEPEHWQYEYAMRDHLGNTRITFADLNYDGYLQANPGDWIANDPHGSPVGYTEVLQENHYYPFGMNMEGPWREPEVKAKVNRYQYNGKELNSDLGLGWNDYGARWYDAAVGRWNAADPLAEEAFSWSMYSYVLDNPLLLIDPTGMKWVNPYKKDSEEHNTVNDILNDLKTHDEELYNFIENLTFKNSAGNETQAMVFVYISNIEKSPEKDGIKSGNAITPIGLSEKKDGEYNGNKIKIPGGDIPENRENAIIGGDKTNVVPGVFDVLLYRNGQNSSSLANEAGNIMFSFEYNDVQDEEISNKRGGYYDKPSEQYSNKVMGTFMNRKNGTLSKNRKVYPLIYSRGKITPNDGGSFKDE